LKKILVLTLVLVCKQAGATIFEPTILSLIKFPFRRIRENPGGNASMANFWDPETATEFKPTRRYVFPSLCESGRQLMLFSVRQGPGGHDSISEVSLCGYIAGKTCT
jgi:hypothetical protein